jgi:deazaflavin-dependent oxidoreductase (nitroreductase family)
MPPVRYSPFHAFIQRLSASAAASWFLAHVLRYVDRFVLKLSRGRTTLTAILSGMPVITVTTTGARSGRLRTSQLVPILDPSDARRFALVASNFGQHRFPSWYFNLKATPRATCIFSGRAMTCVAHEASGEEYDRFSAYATDTYFGYKLYRERAGRRIPIMVMETSEEGRS